MDIANTSGIKSPFSPRVRQSLPGRRGIGQSTKKNQNKYMQSSDAPTGDVIYKTPQCTVETYGSPLPVLVTETLTFASGEVSVRLSACGWCWLVAGRRVVAWAREAGPAAGPTGPTAAARELSLPQTDLAHKADLVVLFYEDGSQMPSCIGVSPEGVVRYWPSVAQEGVYADVSAELAGQECDKLSEYTSSGLILATTTCTVVLLNPAVIEGRATVVARTLRPPSGWLGGLGRRVSLLFFGAMPPHVDTKLVGVACVEGVDGSGGSGGSGGAVAVVGGGAGGPLLQLWAGGELHGHALRKQLAERAPVGELSSVEVVALDARGGGPGALLLLVAALNVARSPDMRYAIAHVCVSDPLAPRVVSLVPLRAAAPEADAAPRFLPLGSRALLYTHNYIALVSNAASNEKPEYVDVGGEGDRILGAEVCGGVPLLVSRKHGVLRLAHAQLPMDTSICDSPMGSPCPSDMYEGNLSLYEIDPNEVAGVTRDVCGKLKTAFLFHVRGQAAAARALLDELFPAPPAPAASAAPDDADVDAVLDRTVLKVATEMLDDVPAGDPRWAVRGAGGAGGGAGGAAARLALGSSAALHAAAQLRDKQRALALFLEFLRAHRLLPRLHLVTDEEGGVVRTGAALCALAERLAAAAALRRLHRAPHKHLLDHAIYQVVCGAEADEWEEDEEVSRALSSGALSACDAAYRRASRAWRLLRAVARHAPPHAPPHHYAAALHVLTSVLSEVAACRQQWAALGTPPALVPPHVLPAFKDLHTRALCEARVCADAGVRAQVREAAAALADLLLGGCGALPAHHYRRLRADLIHPFVEDGQIERAAALAEKFKDFDLLIEMCVKNDDMERLYSYMDKYANEGMCEATFAWLCSGGGRQQALLVRAVGARRPQHLAAWLRAAPAPPRPHLLALHLHATHHHAAAAAAYAHLATTETDSVARMTTMASLAKLCLVASEEESQPSELWDKVECQLSLGEQHRALPRDLRIHHGLDADDTRVLQPEDLIEMYVSSSGDSLTEYDYKKALDLTELVADAELRDDLRLRVWCASIARDEWRACPPDAANDLLQRMTFFRLVDLVLLMGGDLELLLPPVEDILTARSLAELVSEPKVQYLIKYGYECLGNQRAHAVQA